MIWVGWRQQRTETLVAAAMLTLVALFVVPTGIQMAHAYTHDGIGACLGPHHSFSCARAVQAFTSRFEPRTNLIAWLTLLPGVVGVLLAAPLVLELEHGTHRLAWTQSITRRRWLAGKLGLAVGGALVFAIALTVLLTWWRAPLAHVDGRMEVSSFDSEGTVIVGYTLFALGLALAIGVIWRRAAVALLGAFGGYFAIRLFGDMWLRQRLLAPLTATWSGKQTAPASLNRAWVLAQYPSDRFGHHAFMPVACVRPSPTPSTSKAVIHDCLLQNGAGYTHAVFEPASRFWALQGIETGLFAGVAVLLIAFAAWWTHERAA